MLVKIPSFIKRMYPKRIWDASPEGKRLYLTFDDGPIPEVTPWVLEQLEKYKAKATFFCIGDNVKKHPATFLQVLSRGHSIGNHTHNHLNGWKTAPRDYLVNANKAQEVILAVGKNEQVTRKPMLFRPPYGKITRKQAQLLSKSDFCLVMWDVLTYDYKADLTPDYIFKKVVKHTRPGSVLLFHDSLKAQKNMKEVLPRILEYFSGQGFIFDKL